VLVSNNKVHGIICLHPNSLRWRRLFYIWTLKGAPLGKPLTHSQNQDLPEGAAVLDSIISLHTNNTHWFGLFHIWTLKEASLGLAVTSPAKLRLAGGCSGVSSSKVQGIISPHPNSLHWWRIIYIWTLKGAPLGLVLHLQNWDLLEGAAMLVCCSKVHGIIIPHPNSLHRCRLLYIWTLK
jgi:hypothetical protein